MIRSLEYQGKKKRCESAFQTRAHSLVAIFACTDERVPQEEESSPYDNCAPKQEVARAAVVSHSRDARGRPLQRLTSCPP